MYICFYLCLFFFSDTNFSKVSETNGMRPAHVFEETLQTADSKLSSSPNNPKKVDFPTTNREKISFGFRTNSSTALIASPKSKMTPSETVSNLHGSTAQITSSESKINSPELSSISCGALVPYVKDSSESSNSSDSSVRNSDIKPHAKQKSLENHQTSPLHAMKAKTSKSVVSSSPTSKVNATGSWIVTDVPQTPSCYSSNSNAVNSTTDWQVIEASDSKSANSPKFNDGSCNKTERSLHTSERSTSSGYLTNLSLSLEKSPNNHNSSSLNGNVQKQICNGGSGEINTFKRKFSESPPTNTLLNHSESKQSPSKKSKYAENSLHMENGFRNSDSIVDNNPSDSASAQKLYSNGDVRSRTNVINRVSNLADSFKSSPRKNGFLNGAKHENDAFFSKGKIFFVFVLLVFLVYLLTTTVPVLRFCQNLKINSIFSYKHKRYLIKCYMYLQSDMTACTL